MADKLNIKIPQRPGLGLGKYFPKQDPLAVDLLEKMLEYNPKRRITADEILRHPYLNEGHFEKSMASSFYKQDQGRYPPTSESLYLSNGNRLRQQNWEDSGMKASISTNKMESYMTNQRKEKSQRESLYLPEPVYPEKFEISALGKIVPSKKFHQSLYDPQEEEYQTQYSRKNSQHFQNLNSKYGILKNKKNRMRYSEYRKDELQTPKGSIRRTINMDSRNEEMVNPAFKHLSYSHGGKELRNQHLIDEDEYHPTYQERVPRRNRNFPSGRNFEGGLKMKKMQFERNYGRRGKRASNFQDKKKFETNHTFLSGKNLDIYSANFSPSKQYNKAMS